MTPKNFPYLEPTKPLSGKERANKIMEQIPLHPEDALQLYHELAFCCFPGVDHPLCEKACDYLIANGNEEQVFDGCWLKSDLAALYQRPEEAIKLLKKCEEIEPEHEALHSRLGDAYMTVRQFDDAVTHYLHNLKINEVKDEDGDSSVQDWDYEQTGQAYFAKKDYANAFGYFTQALDMNDENVDAICGIGRVMAQEGKYDQALELFKEALEINPDDAYIHFYMGLTWASKDDFYRAMHHYTEALKLKPDFAEVYNDIGKLYHDKEGDVKTAVENMLKAIESVNENNTQFLSVIYLNVSKLYRQMAEFELAEHYKGLFMQSLGFDFEIDDEDGEGGDDDDTTPLN